MSAEQELTGMRCYCGFCMGQSPDDPVSAWGRTYYVPDPPKVPDPPGSISNTAPPEEPGWTGPRFWTLLRGDDWNDPQVGIPAAVTYTFATRAMSNYARDDDDLVRPGFDATSGQPLSEVQKASIRQALGAWEQVSGLTFVEVSDPDDWSFDGIRFLMESVDVYDLLGVAMPNDDPYGFNIVFNRPAYAGATLQPGTQGYWTALHEIGHAIGLKHPFQGDPVLKVSEDNNKNTVMSYLDKGGLWGIGPFDVAAVQHIYGTPEMKMTLPIRWSQGPNGSLVTTGNDQANTIIGISGRDIVYGNGDGDYIATGDGDDHVVSGSGSDAVFGGAGDDALYTPVLRQQAAVAQARGTEGPQGTIATTEGMDSFYGVETVGFVDGSLALDPNGKVGQLYRLYLAAFDRQPDAPGFSHWADALQDGTATVAEVANRFTASAEFAARYGALSDTAFVTELYRNVLDRPPAPTERLEVNYWVNAIHAGGGRGGVLHGFAETAENKGKTEAAFKGGMWFANEDAVDVVRAYAAVLDRLPDAGGLVNWTNAREFGLAQNELIASLASSPEFQARFGGLSNQHFVEQLYRTALDRQADAGGLAHFTSVLDAGIDSRAGVALGFASSAEMTAKIAPFVEYGAMYA